ncbi:MAG TPA: Hpt domain-containing protein [Cyanophyceae cyanobacterium]
MDAGNQQRILGYFIEEAKEHLDTLEKGLLNLHSVVKEPERVNEMFRAAHSIKGGAAMLGFSSIQKTAHRLEDSFKVLKENDINVDRKLETLFLQGYDTLKDLIEQLQGPFGLREEDADKTVKAAEPNFAKLQEYLNRLVGSDAEAATAAPSTPSTGKATPSKVPPNFASQVMDILKLMLQLFKQKDTPESRQKLQVMCKRLAQLGAGVEAWQGLMQTTYKAVSNSKNSYQSLAPLVIKELKQASDQVQAGKASAIAISPDLQKLVTTAPTAAAKTASAATKTPSAAPKQITLPVEPKAAAKALIQAFDKQQLSQLVKLLAQAARASS